MAGGWAALEPLTAWRALAEAPGAGAGASAGAALSFSRCASAALQSGALAAGAVVAGSERRLAGKN